jgi:DNA polymerase III delta subunit
MLYVFFGKDETGVRKGAHEFVKTLTQNFDDVSRITSDIYVPGMLDDATESVSLFGEAQVFLIDTPSCDPLFNEDVKEALESMAKSRNHFVIIEKGLTAPERKVYEKHTTAIEEFVPTTGKSEYNVFNLCDALLERDKKKLWLLLMESEGVASEEIIGVLFWQIKLLRLAEKTRTPEEAGQKPFPYNKAKRALTKFKKGEVDALSRSLTQLYHDGHGGKVDLRAGLERWVLSI